MKDKKIVALNSSGSEDRRVATSLRMLGKAFMLLKGLSTLRVLNERKLTLVATRSKMLKGVRANGIPRDDDDEIYEVPAISEVRVLVDDKAHT